jgi:acetoin utilization protein AcuB
MLVKDWMTKEVITLEENESILKAAQILKKYKIRRLPITKDGKLVGIITHTDINAVAPSKVTPLDVHELYSFLAEIKVKEVMTKNPLTVKPDNTVEYAAILMLENKISGLPVVNEHNYVVGIITQTDIFKLLIEISGVYKSSYHLGLLIKSSEDIPLIFDLFKSLKISIHSMFVWEDPEENKNKIFVFIRLEEEDKQLLEHLQKELKKRFELLYLLKEDLTNIPHKLEENKDFELLLL